MRAGSASARRPLRTLAIALAVLAAAAPGLLRLELRTDGAALAPADDPAVVADREVRRHFGLRDPLLVILETDHPDGIYNSETLDRLDRLTRAVAALPGVDAEHVVSLATEKSPRFRPPHFDFYGLLEPPPVTPERLAEVRDEVEAADVFHGTLVSGDRSAATVMVGVPEPAPPGVEGGPDRLALYRAVVEAARPFETGGHRLSVVGAPAAEALLGEHVLHDLALLVPLALAVVAAVLWLACRRAEAAAVGLAKVGAAQLFTFGLLGWCGEPVFLPTAAIPVILTTVGIADEIHLLWSFYRRPAGEPAPAAIERTLRELVRPVVFTSLTTAAAFLTFLTSSIRPVASFGLFTAVGVLFAVGWSLLVTPALLALLPASSAAAGARESRLPALASLPARRRRWTVPALVAATALLALGLSRVEVQDSWLLNFSSESPLRRATERADRLLAGSHVLDLALTFDVPPERHGSVPAASGPLLSLAEVDRVAGLEDFLRERPEVGGVLGLASQLSTTSYLFGERLEVARELVDDPGFLYIHVRRIANVRGEARRRELIDDDFRRTVITVLLPDADYRRTAELVSAVRRYEAEHLAPAGVRIDLAGDIAVSQAMIPAIVRTQATSLALALIVGAVLAGLLFRSPAAGLVAIAPAAVALVWILGAMGWLAVPLGVATSTFCAVSVGIGIDYSLHLISRHRAARRAGVAEPGRAALAAAGPAILVDALAVSGGFGLLAFSEVPTNRWLGLAVAAALASSALITLAGTGGALLALDRRRVRRPAAAAPPVPAAGAVSGEPG